MRLFIGALAFPGQPEMIDATKIGTLAGSLIAAVLGCLVLRMSSPIPLLAEDEKEYSKIFSREHGGAFGLIGGSLITAATAGVGPGGRSLIDWLGRSWGRCRGGRTRRSLDRRRHPRSGSRILRALVQLVTAHKKTPAGATGQR
jgi:hypothetical protein